MRVIRLLSLAGVLLLGGICWADSAEYLPPAAKETLDAFEKEAAEIQAKIGEEKAKAAGKAADDLKVLQDKFCKEAKLDEAVAIRDQIRLLRGGEYTRRVAELPPAAVQVMDTFDRDVLKVQNSIGERLQKVRSRADSELKKIQDKLCVDEKLDEAIAVRDVRRLIKLGITKAQPDPGFLNAGPADIGKVWYFELVANNGGATWGTDVYTTGSHLGATAIHSGALRAGEKGIVKVTILPGQDNYPATTQNGVVSQPWGNWNTSFKVERLSGLVRPAPRPAESK